MITLKRTAYVLVIASAVLALVGAETCRAQNYGPYLKVSGGVNLVPDNDVKIGGADGTLSLDAGFRVDATIGYELNRWLAVEVEGGFTDNSVNKLTKSGSAAEFAKDSSLTQIPVLAGLVARYENSSDFVPYIGAGAGAVMTTLKLGGEDDDTTVFAWQGKAGVIYKIDERAWLDAGYKLLGTVEQDFQFTGVPLKTKEFFNHFFGVSVIWKF